MAFDENGLVIKRYNEILTDIQDDQIANIERKFKYQNNKGIYQLNAVYALQAERLAELLEAAFDTLKLSSAEGRYLEEIGLIRGVYRLPAASSSTNTQWVIGKPGTVVNAGTRFGSSTLSDVAVNTQAVSINTDKAKEVTVKVTTVVAGANYNLVINGVTYATVATSGSSLNDLRSDIIGSFAGTPHEDEWNWEVLAGEGEFKIVAEDDLTVSVKSNTTYITLPLAKVEFYAQLIATGPNVVPIGAMDTLKSSVSGVEETGNTTEYSEGRDRETDSQLRLRIINGDVGGCTGTILAIQNAVLTNVSGVTFVNVIENTTETPTDAGGRPFGTYEVIVLGGDNTEVAQEVWRTKPAGIPLFGNTDIWITDSSDKDRLVHFSRPVAKHIAVHVTYSLYEEEQAPENIPAAITQAVVEYVGSLPIGKDVIPGRFFGPLYRIPGLEDVHVAIAVKPESGGTGGYGITTRPISETEYASVTEADVTTELV